MRPASTRRPSVRTTPSTIRPRSIAGRSGLHGERPHFDRALGHAWHFLGPRQRFFQVRSVDEVVAGQLLLGLGKRAVNRARLATGELDAGGRRDRLELGAPDESRRLGPWPRQTRDGRRRSSPSLPCSWRPRRVRPRKSAVCTSSFSPFPPARWPGYSLDAAESEIDNAGSRVRNASTVLGCPLDGQTNEGRRHADGLDDSTGISEACSGRRHCGSARQRRPG